MSTDKEILTWFRNQFDEENNLKDVTSAICQYINRSDFSIPTKETLHNLLKAIRQDISKIHLSICRIHWLNTQVKNNKERDPLFENSYGGDRTSDFIGMDIEYFFVKYRSIIDYSVDLLVLFYPELKKKKYKLEDKMNYLHDIFDESEMMSKMILSSKWYDQFRNIRNSIVHAGASCLVFQDRTVKEVLFQVYDTEVEELLFDDENYRFNENVYFFNRIYVMYMAHLFFYLDTLFKSIVSKNEKVPFSAVEEPDFSNDPLLSSLMKTWNASYRKNTDVLLEWLEDFLQQIH